MRIVDSQPADVSAVQSDRAAGRFGAIERRNYCGDTSRTSGTFTRMAASGPVSAALQAWREDQRAQVAQVLRTSVVGMPYGQRIRNLRMVLGWSQREAARQLQVAVRTVIRHEREESFRLRLPKVEKLRALEDANAEELLAYLVYMERNDAPLGGRSNPGGGELQGSTGPTAATG